MSGSDGTQVDFSRWGAGRTRSVLTSQRGRAEVWFQGRLPIAIRVGEIVLGSADMLVDEDGQRLAGMVTMFTSGGQFLQCWSKIVKEALKGHRLGLEQCEEDDEGQTHVPTLR